MTKILAIAGSYRKGGITDQAVEVAAREAREHGAEIEVVQPCATIRSSSAGTAASAHNFPVSPREPACWTMACATS